MGGQCGRKDDLISAGETDIGCHSAPPPMSWDSQNEALQAESRGDHCGIPGACTAQASWCYWGMFEITMPEKRTFQGIRIWFHHDHPGQKRVQAKPNNLYNTWIDNDWDWSKITLDVDDEQHSMNHTEKIFKCGTPDAVHQP